jgi:hypothetical protein
MSKLESLPNEILVDLLEKYVNGVDIFIAFAVELNKRFDALIDQCQQFHFDFESIRKDEFRLCIGLLPYYRDKIESLTLSEVDTPGQIHAFLSFFPTFDQFKRLRQLHLNFDGNTVEKNLLKIAIQSLLKTNIQTLSIRGKNASVIFQSGDIILAALPSITLRQLFLTVDIYADSWNFRLLTSFNVQHLIIEGNGCTWNNLMTIFKCATRLSYLNVRVIHNSSYYYQSTIGETYSVQPIIKLRTLILQFIQNDPSKAFELLVPYLRFMPNLRHIEIIDEYGRFLNGFEWRKLLERSLPLLNRFVLKSGISCIGEHHLLHFLTSFQTPFWIEKTTFNVYIISYSYVDHDLILNYHPIDSRFYINNRSKSEQRSHSFWTIPQRPVNDNRLLMNNLKTLCVSAKSSIFSTHNYFHNVKHLTVTHLNLALFEWITTNINLLNLTELRIPHLETETNQINLLLTRTEYISSLQIHFKQLFTEHSALIGEYKSIKRLDISVSEHPFRQEDILALATLFPSIQHLKINTIDLVYVPLLNTYLPKLHSLTFKIGVPFQRYGYILIEYGNHQMRSQTQFLFKRTNESITIWTDQATFQEPFWQIFLRIPDQLDNERPVHSHKSKCICC